MSTKKNRTKVVIQMSQEPRIFTRMIETLERAFEHPPQRLLIEFVCAEPLLPDTALILHELLVTRPRGLELITRARSGLINASVLPWLMGDVREMRHNGWIYIHIPTPLMEKLVPALETKDGRAAWRDEIFDFFPPDTHYLADWERVLRLIEPYFPLEDIAGKRLTPEDLLGLGVLTGNPIDRLLEQVQQQGLIVQAQPPLGSKSRNPKSRLSS